MFIDIASVKLSDGPLTTASLMGSPIDRCCHFDVFKESPAEIPEIKKNTFPV